MLGQERVHRPAGTRWPTIASASKSSRFGSDEPCTPTILFDPNQNASTIAGLLSSLLGARPELGLVGAVALQFVERRACDGANDLVEQGDRVVALRWR